MVMFSTIVLCNDYLPVSLGRRKERTFPWNVIISVATSMGSNRGCAPERHTSQMTASIDSHFGHLQLNETTSMI